jgi:uncharacterized protein (TIGR00266 family)
MSDWYFAVGNKQQGPITEAQLAEKLNSGAVSGDTLVFGPGLINWTPLKGLPQFSGQTAVAPPPMGSSKPSLAHEIDYQIVGEEMQFVEIELDPGESAVAEAGGMMYMTADIKMTTVFGDGSAQADQSGFMGKLLSAGKRLVTGESLFTTVFTHGGTSGKAHVAFASPYPGKIIPVDLAAIGGTIICQKDAFLAAAKGVSIGIHFQKKLGVGLFGGEGFIMQKLEGDGLAFLHAGGTIIEKKLARGETLKVDTGCLVALDPSVNYDIEMVKGVKSIVFGGEGLFYALCTGPGTVWLQSLPFSRLAGRIHAAMPTAAGGSSVGEGSVLGGLGDLIGGD